MATAVYPEKARQRRLNALAAVKEHKAGAADIADGYVTSIFDFAFDERQRAHHTSRSNTISFRSRRHPAAAEIAPAPKLA